MIVRKLILLNKYLLTTSFFVFFFSNDSYAYIGLGPLIPILGNVIVFIFVTLLAFLGFVVYPIKKILDKKNIKKKQIKRIKK